MWLDNQDEIESMSSLPGGFIEPAVQPNDGARTASRNRAAGRLAESAHSIHARDNAGELRGPATGHFPAASLTVEPQNPRYCCRIQQYSILETEVCYLNKN